MDEPHEESIAAALRSKIWQARELLAGMREVEETDFVAPLVHIIEESIDLAEGLLSCGSKPLPVSRVTLTRALFERLFQASWVALSSANALSFREAGVRETARQIRKMIKDGGPGRIVAKGTGEDRTEELRQRLEAMSLRAPPTFEVMADEAGLKAIHAQLYGVMAQMAHGNTVGLPSKEGGAFPMLSAGSACLRGVTAIARERVLRGAAIPPAQLLRDLYSGG
jgi:hypothetical protein